MKKKTIPSIEKKFLCPVIGMNKERLQEKEEIRPPTLWEEFEDILTIGLISTQGNLPIVLETMKKHWEIKKLKK